MKSEKTQKHNKKKILYVIAGVFLLVALAGLAFYKYYPQYVLSKKLSSSGELKYFTAEELKKFDGSNPKLPILMSYQGNIYDVTSGKEFYQKGATYNYLVGRDSTAELDEVGVGGIIISKYPVVGKLKQ